MFGDMATKFHALYTLRIHCHDSVIHGPTYFLGLEPVCCLGRLFFETDETLTAGGVDKGGGGGMYPAVQISVAA